MTSSNSSSPTTGINALRLIVGFIPFVIFDILSGRIAVGWASLIAAVVAVVAVISDLKGGVKVVPILGIGILGLLTVFGFVGGAQTGDLIRQYGRGAATLTLAAYVLITFRVAPFSIVYAKRNAPPDIWDTPGFLATNQKISAGWGVALLASGLCNVILGFLQSQGIALSDRFTFVLGSALPIVAIVIAVRYTLRTAAAARNA